MGLNFYKTKILTIFAIAVCFLAASCEFAGKLINPQKKLRANIVTKVYEKDGLSFSYPDNWRVTEDTILEGATRYLTLEDADNSVFIITLPEAGYTMDLDEYSGNFIDVLKKEVPFGEVVGEGSVEINRIIQGESLKGVRKNFSIKLLGEKVPHTTDFFSVTQGDRQALIAVQSPDEDLKAADPEFEVIFNSLKF